MNFYDVLMSPLEIRVLKALRRKCVAHAKGHVLEIGIGTGANFPYYRQKQIASFTGMDVALAKALAGKGNGKKFVTGTAEQLPFSDASFDTVVATLVLCSVQNLQKSITEIKRVLKPGGHFVFIEHILPHGPHLAAAFTAVNRPWAALAGGCNLTRTTDSLLQQAFPQNITAYAAKSILCYGIAKKAVTQ